MDGGGDLGDVLLEQPQGVGVREHDAGHVRVEAGPQGVEVDQAPPVGGNRNRLVAAEGYRRRVGAVGGVGDDHLVAGLAFGLVIGPHEQESGQFAGRPGRRLQGGGGHAGDPAQGVGQRPQQLQPALGAVGRGAGMGRRQAGQGGRVIAQLGVVLHGAGPERVGAQVHRVLAVGEPGDVGDQVPLGHLGERDGLGAQPGGGDQLLRRPIRARRWSGRTRPAGPGWRTRRSSVRGRGP